VKEGGVKLLGGAVAREELGGRMDEKGKSEKQAAFWSSLLLTQPREHSRRFSQDRAYSTPMTT